MIVTVRGRSTVGLPFSRKLLQSVCQGDAKRRGPHTRAFYSDPAHPGPPNHACASPVTLQTLLSGSKASSTSGWFATGYESRSELVPCFFFLCEPLFLQTCPLDARPSSALAADSACCWSNSVGMFCLEFVERKPLTNL